MFLYSLLLLLCLFPLYLAVALGDVLGQADQTWQLLAAATDDLPGDEEDDTVVTPQLTLQLLHRQHRYLSSGKQKFKERVDSKTVK